METKYITVAKCQYPIAVLDPLKKFEIGRKFFPKILSFLESKFAINNVTSRVTNNIVTVTTSEETAHSELVELSEALNRVRDEFGPSYLKGDNFSSIFIFNYKASVESRLNAENGGVFRKTAIHVTLIINPKWPSIHVPLPSDSICPLDGRRQCAYCKWWYNREDNDCCTKCSLFQLDDYATEADVPCYGDERLPDPEWIQVGRTINGYVEVNTPDTLRYGVDELDIKILEYPDGKDGFFKAQIVRWCSRELGKNPSPDDLFPYLKCSDCDLIYLAHQLASPLNLIIDVVEISGVSFFTDYFELTFDLKMYLDMEAIEKPYSLSTFPYWTTTHKFLAAFLMDEDTVEEVGDPLMKTICSENDLMVASAEGCGYYTDKDNSLVDMFKSLLQESRRLEVEIIGFHYNGSLDDLRPEYPVASKCYRSLRTSVTRHLCDLENLGYNPAPLIEGLTVDLLDFQSQTLQWALDQERLEGGINRRLYAPILSSEGEETEVWFSPFLNRITPEKPLDVRGGFICEEMGLGKTVICLALILANPAPAVDSPDADDHWGLVCPRIYSAVSSYQLNDPLFRYKYDSLEKAKEAQEIFKMDAEIIEKEAKKVAAQNPKVFEFGKGRVREFAALREMTHKGYLKRDDVKARRKEFFAKLSAAVVADDGEEDSKCVHNIPGDVVNVDMDVELEDAKACPACLYDINGWPANIAALKAVNLRTRGTLVVCPVSLVGQWSSEAREKLADKNMNIYEYHGSSRKRQAAALSQYDIVITTYETLGADMSTYNPSNEWVAMRPPLLQLNWHRIIFDESHRMSKQAKMTIAVQALCSKRRWMVTGTPFSNNVESICTQWRGLGLGSGADKEQFWKNMMQERSALSKNCTKRQRLEAMNSPTIENMMGTVGVNALLRRILMRHSNGMTYASTGNTLTNLPAKVEKQVRIALSAQELKEYKQLELQLQKSYLELEFDGVSKNTIKIMALIKRLQMACSGVANYSEDLEQDDVAVDITAAANTASEDSKCSKLNWLMNKLKDIRDNSPEAKVLIFSQFSATFARIVGPLVKNGFQFRTLTSDMTMTQRKKALYDFRDDPPTTIFLLSMRSGAVGLNLTQANHVIIMDPCVNKQLELQAVGRVHRLGQRREVTIYRLACQETVEARILQMHASGEVVSSSSGPAGSLREDRVTLSESRYRSLLGMITSGQQQMVQLHPGEYQEDSVNDDEEDEDEDEDGVDEVDEDSEEKEEEEGMMEEEEEPQEQPDIEKHLPPPLLVKAGIDLIKTEKDVGKKRSSAEIDLTEEVMF